MASLVAATPTATAVVAFGPSGAPATAEDTALARASPFSVAHTLMAPSGPSGLASGHPRMGDLADAEATLTTTAALHATPARGSSSTPVVTPVAQSASPAAKRGGKGKKRGGVQPQVGLPLAVGVTLVGGPRLNLDGVATRAKGRGAGSPSAGILGAERNV